MPAFDTVIRNARVVTAADIFTSDIGIRDGRIVALGLSLDSGEREIDAAGRHVTPGGVDSHVHFDQPTGDGSIMFGERFVAEDGEVCRAWRRHFESLGRSAADPVQGVFARPGYEALLADVRLPLLLFSGELDRAKRPADMQYIAERVAGSRHVTVGDSGHTPPVENPALFAAELLRFWNESTPVAARALN